MAMHNVKEDEWFAEDITKVRAEEIPKADVWCFGLHCQDISIGGKRGGFKGNPPSLFFRVTILIRDKKEVNQWDSIYAYLFLLLNKLRKLKKERLQKIL